LFPSLSLHRYSCNVTHVMVGKHDARLRRAAAVYVHLRNEIDQGLLTSPARVSVRRFVEQTFDPGGLLPRHHAHIRQIPILFRVVQPVPNHEFVRNLEPDVVALDRHLSA
jgi:hypothetical protein